MYHVTLVDDDKDIRELLTGYLEKNGFKVSAHPSAESLLDKDFKPTDLLILDIGLPGMDGLALCREIRKTSDIPILMLTAASDDIDRILGLELGADDYMGKPFNPRELLARAKALIRRATGRIIEKSEPDQNLVMDNTQRKASYCGQDIDLTGAEFDLLWVLSKRTGDIVTRDQLSRELKGHPATPYDRSIDTLVSRLRAKLIDLSDSDPIKSIRGKGYQLVLK